MIHLRKLTWQDVKVTTGHRNRSGKLRVHVSLKSCSIISKTFWFDEWTGVEGLLRAGILLALHHRAKLIFDAISPYVETTT